MKPILHIIVLAILVSASRSSIPLKDRISLFKKPSDLAKNRRILINDIRFHAVKEDPNNFERRLIPDLSYSRKQIQNARDKHISANKAETLKRALGDKNKDFSRSKLPRYLEQQSQLPSKIFRKDPVLNSLKIGLAKYRRRNDDTSSSSISSSSRELQNWKDEWREHWMEKKFEAINASLPPLGDHVNMVAARPWGVPCGDPNQHDMPWGSCVLPMECEAEYRIYRGDYFCGRTQFICCAVQQNTYDLYQGFDASLADTSLATSSSEEYNKKKNSKESRSHKKRRERKKRQKNRLKRKRKLKRLIRKISKEITKILNKSYRNGTTARKKKTKQLKKFVKFLKDQYKKDRKSVKDIHEQEMIKIDAALTKRLEDIRNMNQNFIRNNTFRDVVVNGSISKAGARALVNAYPELGNYFQFRRRNAERPKDYLDYDIEYGLLYY